MEYTKKDIEDEVYYKRKNGIIYYKVVIGDFVFYSDSDKKGYVSTKKTLNKFVGAAYDKTALIDTIFRFFESGEYKYIN